MLAISIPDEDIAEKYVLCRGREDTGAVQGIPKK